MSKLTPAERLELIEEYKRLCEPELRPEVQRMLKGMLDHRPQLQEKLRKPGRWEGQLLQVRDSVRRVLRCRQFTLSPEEHARLDVCRDLPMLQRWLEQSILAASVADALA
jgi:hypothetical protein